jgi:poly-beta-1,6-N-acetyl-D-glucosamine N-deacetylase
MKRILLLICLAVAVCLGTQAQIPDVTVLCYHDVRDNVGAADTKAAKTPGEIYSGYSNLDPDQYAISTRNLASQFDWLASNGYHVISLQQLIEARDGKTKLPDHAVMLTFDDGLKSSYSKVFPLLKAYGYHAVVAVVGYWADLAPSEKVDYDYRTFTRGDFASWEELREMDRSGLVEIASHSWGLHQGVTADPQGNLIPAVLTHAYNVKTRQYETDVEYSARIRADLTRSVKEIESQIGHAPRAIMWPYGAYTQPAEDIAKSLGLSATFTLNLPVTFPNRRFGLTGLTTIPRLVMVSNPSPGELDWSLRHVQLRSNVRAVQVDLDYVYDPNPAQQEKNLSALLDRIKSLHPTQVWLQAFADPDGSGAPSSVYFPNRVLPVRADLFARVAWQLRSRCGVEVYAWMTSLAWQLPDKGLQAKLQIKPRTGIAPETPIRLNPFLHQTRQIIGDVFEDLGRSTPVAGILFSDDAFLRDTDDLGSEAPAPGSNRTQALIQFTNELADHVRHWSPELATARNLFAEPVLHPNAESWYAQSLPAFLSNYSLTAVMAMPELEKARRPKQWLAGLVERVGTQPNGIQKTVFEVQAVDWRKKRALESRQFTQQIKILQDRGALHLAYYPDDFGKNNPALETLVPAFSVSVNPAPQP